MLVVMACYSRRCVYCENFYKNGIFENVNSFLERVEKRTDMLTQDDIDTISNKYRNRIYCISHHRSLVRFSSRRSAEGKRKFSQVNDPVACFWFIFGSRPEVLELARSLNSYFLESYI